MTMIPRPVVMAAPGGPPGAPQPVMFEPVGPPMGPPMMGPPMMGPPMMGPPMMGPPMMGPPVMGPPMPGTSVFGPPGQPSTLRPVGPPMEDRQDSLGRQSGEGKLGHNFGNHIPLARCRVLYLGSAVPTETAEGLDAVQQPLRERYPFQSEGDVPGIDCWLTVFSSGLSMQYVSDMSTVTWFPISSMHVSAAVKCVVAVNGATGERVARFVGLDSEAAKRSEDPPMFACIMRRTKGVKVLECHAFITKSTQAAMALVQSCMHAFDHKEGWNEDAPPPIEALRRDQTMHLVPAEPKQEKKEDASPEFYQTPPQQGYYYTSNKDLVKHYNVHGGPRRFGQPPPPPVGVPIGPPRARSPPPVRGPPPPMMMPPPLPMPRPPPGYFGDWERHGNVPVVMFPAPESMMMGPGPMVYEPERRHRRHHRKKGKKPRSPTRLKSPRRMKSPRRQVYREPSPHFYSDSGSDSGSDYAYHEDMRRYQSQSRPRARNYDEPRHRSREEGRHRSRRDDFMPPVYGYYKEREREPSDLIFYGNRYHEDPYTARPRGKNPRKHGDYVEYDFNPEIFMRESHDLRRDRPSSPPGSPGRLRRADDRSYPRNDHEFGKSIAEERRAVGDMDYPNPYKLNDYRNHIETEDSDYGYRPRIERDDRRGDFDIERGLGYLP